jgi:2-desacetyl-2-hydroxyethyl bacteriochlorophyllide A dehydrogenase
MRAVRFHEPGEPFAVEDVPRPTPGPDEVLVEIRAASVCGSDVHYRTGGGDFAPSTAPLTLGHEGAGVVAEAGEHVTGPAVGDRVVVNYVESCGDCRPCLRGNDNRCRERVSVGHDVPGTFAEYVAVPARSALALPEDVPFEWGSVAACAVATAYHALRRARIEPGDAVAVFGVGGVGQHAVMWADFLGAGSVIAIDPVAAKLEAAADRGADVTLDPTEDDVLAAVADATDGRGVDVAVECSGSTAAIEQAIDSVNGDNKYESGTVVSVGLQEEPMEVEYWGLREGQLLVSGDHTREELRRILDLAGRGRIDLSPSISHRMGLAEANDAIDLLVENEGRVGRIVLEP